MEVLTTVAPAQLDALADDCVQSFNAMRQLLVCGAASRRDIFEAVSKCLIESRIADNRQFVIAGQWLRILISCRRSIGPWLLEHSQARLCLEEAGDGLDTRSLSLCNAGHLVSEIPRSLLQL